MLNKPVDYNHILVKAHNRVDRQPVLCVIIFSDFLTSLFLECSPGMPVAMCASDPCQNAVCQGHKDATCVPNYCGGCGHGFYDSDGNKLHCQGK